MCISFGNRRPYSTPSSQRLSQESMLNGVASSSKEMKVPAPESPISTMETISIGLPTSRHSSPKTRKRHITVQHNYHDHSNDSSRDYQEEHPARGGVTTPFPLKLHDMLDAVVSENRDDIVSWQPHGRCFLVHKPKEFVELLPHYFKLSKIASFQRQLNLYGFQRLTRGRDRGGYYHELFLRDRVFLAHSIQRIKVKGTGVRARSNPDQEPNFWSMPWVESHALGRVSPGNDQLIDIEPTPIINGSIGKRPLQMNRVTSNCFVPNNVDLNPTPFAPTNSTTRQEVENDFLLDAFLKPFHFVEPFQTSKANGVSLLCMENILASEADDFFDDFNFPSNLGNEIEDDQVFGDLLEQMIA